MYPVFVEELYAAHTTKGYSVVELSQILGHSHCRGLYNVMRDEGIIIKMRKGRTTKVETHPGLLKALQNIDLSFTQWAHSHRLDRDAAAKALLQPVNPSDSASVSAHKALRQDFRFLAPKLYGEEIPLGMPTREGRTSSKYSLTIQFSEEEDCFEAFIHELPDCRAVGKTRENAFYALRDRYIIFHSIRKLKLLPPKHLPQAA